VSVTMTRRAMLRALAALAATLGAPALGAARQFDFADVVRGRPLVFPRDFGAHPAFRIEWWYITGWLGPQARGFQITFFRARNAAATDNPSRFTPRQILFAHAALADPRHGRLQHDQRAAREGLTLAGAQRSETRVWIDDWRLAQTTGGYEAVIPAREFTLRLEFAVSRRRCSRARTASAAKGGGRGKRATTTASRSSRCAERSRKGAPRRRSRDAPGSTTNGRAPTCRPKRRAGTGSASIWPTAAR